MKKYYLNLFFPFYISLFLMFSVFHPRNLPAEEISSDIQYAIGVSQATYINGSDTTIYPLNCGGILSLPPGGSISFRVTGGSGSISTIVSLWAESLPPGATFPPCIGSHSCSSIFNWTPESSFIGNVRFIGNEPGEQDTCIISFDWALPIELSSFTYTVLGNDVNLKWQTSTELNNSGFEVQRLESLNGNSNDWSAVGFVTGTGTISSPINYSFVDSDLMSGIYNYRLKQIDFNGNFKYYNLTENVGIGIPDKYELSQNYPNPFNPSSVINYSIANDNFVTLKIFNSAGFELMTLVKEYKNAGFYNVIVNATNLSSGIYYYKLTVGKFESIKKMVILK